MTDPAYKELAGKIEEKSDQFALELRNEIRRLSDTELDLFRFERIPGDSEIIALHSVLDCYEQVLNTSMPTHTRAMIARQHADSLAAYDHLLAFKQAA